MNDTITIINPSKRAGGTVMLFLTIAENLIKLNNFKVELVDYKDGYISNHLYSKKLPFKHIIYYEPLHLAHESTVIIHALHAKELGTKIYLNENSTLNLYVTFTYDFFKYLPIYIFFRKKDNSTKRLVGKIFNNKRYYKVKNYIQELNDKSSLVFMDNDTVQSTQEIFELDLNYQIVPLVTDRFPDKKQYKIDKLETLDVFWIGRLADFKAKTVCSVADAIAASNRKIIFHVIGDGSLTSEVESHLSELKELKYILYGHIDYKDLDALIYKKADLLIGHGLSILKGARMGVASIVADGLYTKIASNQLKVNWLFELPDYEVGKVSYNIEDLSGSLLVTILKEITKKDLIINGNKSYEHWKKFFSNETVTPKYINILKKSSYRYKYYIKAGLSEKDVFIKVKEIFRPLLYKFLFNKKG